MCECELVEQLGLGAH